MPKTFLLFDMDGVLLEPGGYQKALVSSIERIGQMLGVPSTTITSDQIAQFEVLSITNEWDTLAICTAVTLLHVWQFDETIRLSGHFSIASPVTNDPPDFDLFLASINLVGDIPGETVFHSLVRNYPLINRDQRDHLADILLNCRDIYRSITLPLHQETVLGSTTFEAHYKLKAQLNCESFLTKYDRPILKNQQILELNRWLQHPDHHAGLLTNRPCRTPPGFLSSPEAELGIELLGLTQIPYVGSGILGWYAMKQKEAQEFLFLKPNPVHTLALLQRCLGRSISDSLNIAASLWQGHTDQVNWQSLDKAKIYIFEDSVKGLISGKSACQLIANLGIETSLTLVGISHNHIKLDALTEISTYNIDNLNTLDWVDLTKQ